jgi:ankyrin repeat protein
MDSIIEMIEADNIDIFSGTYCALQAHDMGYRMHTAMWLTPMEMAIHKNRLDVVRYLLEHGRKEDDNMINRPNHKGGSMPLHIAAGGGNLGMIRLLLDQPHIDVNAKFRKFHDMTALMVLINSYAFLEYTDGEIDAHYRANVQLLRRDYNPNVRCNSGYSAMELAKLHGCFEVLFCD